MTTSNLKSTLQEAMKERLGTIRLILAAIKQREVDERIELSDEQILAALDKMLKQRRESIAQYEAANREDLACKEAAEIQIIQTFLPVQLTAVEIESLIKAAIAETGAASARDMGKVMGVLKPQLQGRADIGSVSNKIKELLSA
jgi:uncharacterized protein YqeY